MPQPEQYKTGIAYFMDFEIGVTPSTFIPRPETEILVEKTVDVIEEVLGTRSNRFSENPEISAPVVLDLCTGSGNIAISLTKYARQSKIFALDISHSAIIKARENAAKYGVLDKITFIEADLFSAFAEAPIFDVIVSNPPYVSGEHMPALQPEVREEPFIALFGGKDGLAFYRSISSGALKFLKKRGYILMEIGYDQASSVTELLKKTGYSDIYVYRDYSGIGRIVKARI